MPPDASSVSFATYFNPRSSCEERPKGLNSTTMALIFQSTLLMRGATTAYTDYIYQYDAISIHAPHARSDRYCPDGDLGKHNISIHAPHARSDRHVRAPRPHGIPISIHAPHARSDKPIRVWLALNRLISIHAPHARSDCIPINRHPSVVISIHAPHARSDEAFVCRVVNL